MFRRSLPSRFAFWLFACALLLKAAVPLLASASAEAQGLALIEVCTVYGVKTVTLDGEPAQDHQGTHTGDHCALSAVMALDAPQPTALGRAPEPSLAAASPLGVVHAALDASAHWMARLHHGPPRLG
jgi:hypothetical protein